MPRNSLRFEMKFITFIHTYMRESVMPFISQGGVHTFFFSLSSLFTRWSNIFVISKQCQYKMEYALITVFCQVYFCVHRLCWNEIFLERICVSIHSKEPTFEYFVFTFKSHGLDYKTLPANHKFRNSIQRNPSFWL